MGFTTTLFLFVFFPVSVLLYYIFNLLSTMGPLANVFQKFRVCDIVLIIVSLVFYAAAGIGNMWKLCLYIALVYAVGWGIQFKRDFKNRGFNSMYSYDDDEDETDEDGNPKKKKRDWILLGIMVLGVVFVTVVLIVFKYSDFLTDLFTFNFKGSGKASLIAPIGISFITFSSVSYIVDIYKDKASSMNPIDCALYICFFPKVVSGPIVLWRDFKPQCGSRSLSVDTLFDGIQRLMIGFAKKLIIADTFGVCIAKTAGAAIDVPTAWGVNLLFMLQIYFDFSGYSDIAIGLSRIFGFEFEENFNFPYLSTSITDFWRRWHISLGTWFKEYIYIPLGGSRKGQLRTILNLAVVFLISGLWHGAGWTFIIWGLLNGLFRILEKLMENSRFYNAIPSFFKWLVTMVIVYLCWIVFRFTDFTQLIDWFKLMFGIKTYSNVPFTFLYYFDWQIIAFAAIALLGSTILGFEGVKSYFERVRESSAGFMFFRQLLGIALFALAVMFMVSSTYSPFIYMQY